jgi:hypothetical protein
MALAKLSLARKNFPAGDGKTAKFFLQCSGLILKIHSKDLAESGDFENGIIFRKSRMKS